MSITALVDAHAGVIADAVSALFTVAAVIVSVGVSIRGIRYVLELVGRDPDWPGTGYLGSGLSREEYDRYYPLDPSDADDPRNYDWNDDNDPQRHFH